MNIFKFLIKLLRKTGLLPENPLFYIGGVETLPPPLDCDEEREYLNKIKMNEEGAREYVIEHNLRLVVYIARKFENTGINIEDLISIGTIGLIKAVNTYNPDKNIKLATYASKCIENEILMYLRKTANQKTEVSIDEPLNVDWDGNELLLSDVLGTDNDSIYKSLEEKIDKELLKEALNSLSNREKDIMNLRFGLTGEYEKTQKEVADMLGISQSYISRLEKKIVVKLRNEMTRMMQ